MTGTLDHGPVISDEEYEKRIFELYRGLPPMPSKEMEREIQRRELDLLIDHRLGSRFPQERRDALWTAQRHIGKKRLRLVLASLTRAILPWRFRRGVEGLAGFAVDEYAKVLNRDELGRFLDFDERNPPELPLDRT